MLETGLFAFLERTADAAFAVSEQGEICSWNKSAQRLFGYAVSEVANRTCHELLDGRGALGQMFAPVVAVSSFVRHSTAMIPDFDLEVKTKSGSRLWVNISTIVFEEPRRNRRLIVHLARDISHRKKNEDLLARCRISRKKWRPPLGMLTAFHRFLLFPNRSSEFSGCSRGPRTRGVARD